MNSKQIIHGQEWEIVKLPKTRVIHIRVTETTYNYVKESIQKTREKWGIKGNEMTDSDIMRDWLLDGAYNELEG